MCAARDMLRQHENAVARESVSPYQGRVVDWIWGSSGLPVDSSTWAQTRGMPHARLLPPAPVMKLSHPGFRQTLHPRRRITIRPINPIQDLGARLDVQVDPTAGPGPQR